MSNLYETIGTNNPAYLLSSPEGADKIAVPCEMGNGIIKRGAIMYRKASGLWAPATASEITATNDLVVLDQSVDTGSDAQATVAEDAAAYRAARLIAGMVILNAGGTLTAAHALILRQQGLVLDPMLSYPET